MLKLNKNIKKYFHTKKTLVSKVYQPLIYIYIYIYILQFTAWNWTE